MVDRIIVKPDRVRGGGNIISPAKIVDDFSCFESSLVLSGGVFGLSYLPGQEIVVTLSASPVSVSVGGSVTFSATVTGDGDPLEGVTVSFKEGSSVIGTGETNSSGVATLVKSDLSVGVHSVVAGYSTGVSSAVSVTVIDAPVPASVSLTGSKSILSYADSEQSVLTATVLDANDDPVEGVSVDLYKDDTLWDTISTGVDGTVSKTYSSAGVGDVGFTAEVGSLVSETYSIRDTLKYYNTTFSSTQTITLPSNMPIDFKVIWKTTAHTSTTGGGAWIEIGSNSNNLILFGEISADSMLGIYVKVNGGYVVTQQGESILVNDEVEHEYTYNNGNHSISANNKTVSASNSQITDRTYGRVFVPNNRKIKDIMIMPL